MSEAATERPLLARFLWGGVVAGCASAFVNSSYFVAYRMATEFTAAVPTLGSVVLSSLFPPVLAGLGYGLLSRFTKRATLVFVSLTCAITLATFESMLSTTLPDGTLKPPGFDALVMPMHVVVGGLAALIIPRIARGQRRRSALP
jgi:hypothetical protein